MLGGPARGCKGDGLERVRAPGRATRSATWTWIGRRPTPGAHRSRRSPHGSGGPAAVPDVSTWRSGCPNRGPPKARTAPLTSSITVLSSGIDSLYVPFRGKPNPMVLDALRKLKAEARETGQPQVLQLPGAAKALVQPSGWGRYRYWLRCDGFDAFLGSSSGLPAAYARLLSSFIHEVGPTSALAEVNLFVNGPVLAEVEGLRCSRVDIYSDFQGWVPRSGDYQRFVVRSRKNTWHTAVHHDGRSFTGFTFGRDAMVARLYDKSLEITRSGKDWMREVWGDRCGVLSSRSAGRC